MAAIKRSASCPDSLSSKITIKRHFKRPSNTNTNKMRIINKKEMRHGNIAYQILDDDFPRLRNLFLKDLDGAREQIEHCYLMVHDKEYYDKDAASDKSEFLKTNWV